MASKTMNINQKTKNQKKGRGLFIGSFLILVIVVISFVVVPALSDLERGGTSSINLGTYGNEKIEFSFTEEGYFQQQMNRMNQMYGAQANNAFMQQLIAQQAYDQAVFYHASLDEFNENGLFVTEAELDKAVAERGPYQVNGRFSRDLYSSTPQLRRLQIRESIKGQLAFEKYAQDMFRNQRRSDKAVEFMLNMDSNRRNFNYVVFNYNNFPGEQVSKWASDKKDLFAKLSPARITVKTEEEANTVVEKFNAGEAFGELAAQFSTDNFKDAEGVMGDINAYELKEVLKLETTADLIALKEADAPKVFEVDGSFIIIKALKDSAEADLENAETIDTIKAYMVTYEKGIIEEYFLAEAEIFQSNVKDMETLAAEKGLEVKETGLFAINYGDEQLLEEKITKTSQDSIFQSVAKNEDFFKTLFTLEQDKVSEPLVLGDNVAVFKLIEEKTVAEDDIDTYKSIVSETFASIKRERLSRDFKSSEKYEDNFQEGFAEVQAVFSRSN